MAQRSPLPTAPPLSLVGVTTHTELVRIASQGEIDAVDPGSARPELRAVLRLLERVTRAPDAVSARDLQAVRDAGVPIEPGR